MLRWIRSYLTDRHQKVVLGGDESITVPVISSVPQGSVLGLLLFLIYIDDVIRVPLSVGSKLVLYADDMLLYRQLSYLQRVEMQIPHTKAGYCDPPDLLLDDLTLERVES